MPQLKGPGCPTIYPDSYSSLNAITVACDANSLVQVLNSDSRVYFHYSTSAFDLSWRQVNFSDSYSPSCFKFLRRSLLIFIIKCFRIIVFIFIVISTTFRPICRPAYFRCFVELGNLHGTSNYVLYWIHGGRLFWFRSPSPGISVKYSCIVTRL